MTCGGRLRLSNVILISHKPALRAGRSSAPAGAIATTEKAAIEAVCRASCREWRMALTVSVVATDQFYNTTKIIAPRCAKPGCAKPGRGLNALCTAGPIARGNGGPVRRAGVGAGAHGRHGKACEPWV